MEISSLKALYKLKEALTLKGTKNQYHWLHLSEMQRGLVYLGE